MDDELFINLIRYEIQYNICNSYEIVQFFPYSPRIYVEAYSENKLYYGAYVKMRFANYDTEIVAIKWTVSKVDIFNASNKGIAQNMLRVAAYEMMFKILNAAKEQGFIAGF